MINIIDEKYLKDALVVKKSMLMKNRWWKSFVITAVADPKRNGRQINRRIAASTMDRPMHLARLSSPVAMTDLPNTLAYQITPICRRFGRCCSPMSIGIWRSLSLLYRSPVVLNWSSLTRLKRLFARASSKLLGILVRNIGENQFMILIVYLTTINLEIKMP